MTSLCTPRLELAPMTLAMVEAVLQGRRDDAEALASARMPERWPNPELVERAFSMRLEVLRERAAERLWGARVLLARDVHGERRVIGSVVFKGQPDDAGACEIAYGIEEGSQGRGFATEAVAACVGWALAQPTVSAVRASTFPWHSASTRVLEKVGMTRMGVTEHETLGELLVYERRRDGAARF